MAWRERVLQTIGPGILAGVTFGDWVRLLRENRFAIDPPYWLRAQAITTQSLVNAAVRRHEERTYLPQVRAVDVPPPRRLTMFPHTSFSLPAGAGAEHAQEQSNARHSSAATVKVYVAETPDPRC